MQAVDIREKLHEYIDTSDEKLLKLMLALAKEYNHDDEYVFTPDDIKEFDSRRQQRLNGETKPYTWEQAKEIITGKRST